MATLTRILVIVAIFLNNGSALVESTPVQSVASNLKEIVSDYAREHEGKIPSWVELNSFIISKEKPAAPTHDTRSSFFLALDSYLGGPVEERFTLLGASPVEMVNTDADPVATGGTIVALTTGAVLEDRKTGIGRYVIWRDAGGKFRSTWLEESLVAAQFRKAAVKLPSGVTRVQPPTFEGESEQLYKNFARDHFKDPSSPTPEEVEQFKNYLAEKFGTKEPLIASPSSESVSKAPDNVSPTAASPVAAPRHSSTGSRSRDL
jgi:hypothetical protein